LSAEDHRLLDIIRRNSARIDEIVDSVLQLPRRSQAVPHSIELGVWLQEFCREFRETPGLEKERLRLLLPKQKLEVDMDPRHLRQILSNLCDNAVKHGRDEPVPVRVEIRAQLEPIGGSPRIEVADSGPGIAPETTSEIFTPFFPPTHMAPVSGCISPKSLARPTGSNWSILLRKHEAPAFDSPSPPEFGYEKGAGSDRR
jgi:two-component system, NtrC family, sensor histidine kinase PilS